MPSRVELDDDLEVRVARMIAPAVVAVAHEVRDAAALLAPPAKEWVTVEDERVRRSHRLAHGQRCPANIPFILSAPRDDGGTLDNEATTDKEYPMEPRDEILSPANRYNCRCVSLVIPGEVGASIGVGDPSTVGTRLHVPVFTDFERAAESEHAKDGGGWLLGGARVVAQQRSVST